MTQSARVLMLLATALLMPSPAAAQTAAAASTDDVVVRGSRDKQSDWREAETRHVVLVSDGGEAELTRLARNVERLHFLLSGLLGRIDAPDETVKLRVTLIGDVAEFAAMDLRNLRWQQGPFREAFDVSRYYDPRETGAVLATTRVEQRIRLTRSPATAERVLGVLEGQTQSGGGSSGPGGGSVGVQGPSIGALAIDGMRGSRDLSITVGNGGDVIPVTAESLLYAGYAQHFLLTYFPAAYPRWYLDGFGQIFASLVVRGDDVLEFGRTPQGTSAVLQEIGSYPIGDVLSDTYLTQAPDKTRWTPVHAWLLTHFLFFSDARRPQLRRYLALRANGADPAVAAAVFGDQQKLAQELRRYFGARKPADRVTYPAGQAEPPVIRRLTQGEAAFVNGRLEVEGRIVLSPAPLPSVEPAVAQQMTKARDAAIRRRDKWLVRLHRDADRWPNDLSAQLLLAEAECRSGHAQPCLVAATQATALAPRDVRALAWQGTAMAAAAVAGPADARAAALIAARRVIATANRLDNEAIEPLLAYHASYTLAGATPPVSAIDGLQKAMLAVPAAPATRLALAKDLAARNQTDAVRLVLLPVAEGAYDSPERAEARALLHGKAGLVASE